ncbi:MAG: hypothetical protein ACLR6O_07765 [Eubacterium sp.]
MIIIPTITDRSIKAICIYTRRHCLYKGRCRYSAGYAGEELWFSLKTAAEICVKINGKYVGGVDPNRERMLFLLIDDIKLFILK